MDCAFIVHLMGAVVVSAPTRRAMIMSSSEAETQCVTTSTRKPPGGLLIGVHDKARRELAVMRPAPAATNRRRAVLRPTARHAALRAKSTTKTLLLGRQQPLRRPVPRVVDGVVARVHDEVRHGPVARARVARVQDAVIKREERPARHARRHQFEIRR